MRYPIFAAAALVALATPAWAQMTPPGGFGPGRMRAATPPPVSTQTPVSESEFRAATAKIPESKEKFDPWRSVRPEPAPTQPRRAKAR